MRRTLGLAVLGITVLGVAAVASAGEEGGADLVFTEKVTEFTRLDLGDPGIGQGDRDTYRADLVGEDGKVVGSSAGECVSVEPEQDDLGRTSCTGFFDLGGGQLTFAGLYDLTAKSGSVAITGGTGDYAGARGTGEFTTASPTEFPYEVHLVD